MKNALLLLFPIVLLSCKPPMSTPTQAPTPTIPPTTPAPTLFDLLAHERATRAADASPRIETVQSALAARGLAVQHWKQVLARPVAARYCLAGSTELGVGVAVCEYDHPAAAAAGRARSRAVFDRLIPNRELVVRGSTLLTLTRPAAAGTGPAAAEARRLATAFTTL